MKSFGLKELAEHYFATESEVTDYVAVSDYEKLLAERDALAANVNVLRKALRDQLNDCINFDSGKLTGVIMMNSSKLLAETPQQCLAEIKAEAGLVGFIAGCKHADKPSRGMWSENDLIEHANQYAAKIRNAGTWLKDSNVNGRKRQGGAE